jgi:hypothetical protein
MSHRPKLSKSAMLTATQHGFSRYVGIATFPDDSTGGTTVWTAYDGVAGAGNGGASNGYGSIIFSDGSELWTKFSGTYKITSVTQNAVHLVANGTLTVTGGKGRFEGVKGDGTWEGPQDRVGSSIPGETLAVVDYVVNLKK